MTTCPQCGRQTAEGAFCSRCGAELPPSAHESPPLDEVSISRQRGEPTLELDRLCPLFENMNGTLRFRFNPQGGGYPVENVVITFSNCDCAKTPVQRIRRALQLQEFPVQFPPQLAGMQSWNVRVEYVSDRRKHELTGDFQVIVRPVESRKRGADVYTVNIGSVGNASDVNVRLGGASETTSDPFAEMMNVYASDRREWMPIQFSDDNQVVDLPPMPDNAKTDRIVVEIGGRRIHFFANRTVTFGRRHSLNDIALLPPGYGVEFDSGDHRCDLYKRISGRHCLFEHSGRAAILADGFRDEFGAVHSSRGGTFWNNGQLSEPVELPVGTSGIVSFGGVHYGDNLSLDLKVCEPVRACATCPHANIRWCGEGQRPSLMLTRRDGPSERYVGLWSCFWLGEADPSFDGVVIFRKDGAFAYRCDDGRSGWLVPGTTVQTDFGLANVS